MKRGLFKLISGKLVFSFLLVTLMLFPKAGTSQGDSLRPRAVDERNPEAEGDGVQFVMDHPNNFPDLLLNLSPTTLANLHRRGQVLKAVYPRLPRRAKRILLRPDVLSVCLGVNRALISSDVDLRAFYMPMIQDEAVSTALPLLLMPNHIIDYAYFINRLNSNKGNFLIEKGVMTDEERIALISGEINQQKMDLIKHIMNQIGNDPVRGMAFSCFANGYPLQEAGEYINLIAQPPTIRITTRLTGKYFLNILCARATPRLFKLIETWDAGLDYGYGLFSGEADFATVMLPNVLSVFNATRSRGVPLSRFLTAIHKTANDTARMI